MKLFRELEEGDIIYSINLRTKQTSLYYYSGILEVFTNKPDSIHNIVAYLVKEDGSKVLAPLHFLKDYLSKSYAVTAYGELLTTGLADFEDLASTLLQGSVALANYKSVVSKLK